MRDVMGGLVSAWQAGETVALATVVHTTRSAPRPPGASMVVRADGSVLGSVSGGCVEGAVHELGLDVVRTGEPVTARFGYSDAEGFAVGLTCGGTVEVHVEAVCRATFGDLDEVAADVDAGRPVAVATVVEHPDAGVIGRRVVVRPSDVQGSLGSPRRDDAIVADAVAMLGAGSTGTLTYGPDGQRMETGMRVFVASYAPPPRLIVFGAIDFAAALARQSSLLGHHVTVCDARALFCTPERFPTADEVVVRWPHDYLQDEVDAGRVDHRTVVCVLTHDPKFDVPVLDVALRLEGARRPAFVGAMGSRLTHDDRIARLRDVGLTDRHLARLRSPIGLDLGGRTPEETAVSIVAQVVAERHGGTGRPLAE